MDLEGRGVGCAEMHELASSDRVIWCVRESLADLNREFCASMHPAMTPGSLADPHQTGTGRLQYSTVPATLAVLTLQKGKRLPSFVWKEVKRMQTIGAPLKWDSARSEDWPQRATAPLDTLQTGRSLESGWWIAVLVDGVARWR